MAANDFDIAELLPEAVRQELAAMGGELRSSIPQTLAQLLERWRGYAAWVSSERPVPFDDYQAMLFARDRIQGLIDGASMTTGKVLAALASDPDGVFISGTRPDWMNLLRPPGWAQQSEPRPWWWQRVPAHFDRTGIE